MPEQEAALRSLEADPRYEKLISSLVEQGALKTPHIIDAFRKINRRNFLPESVREFAYEDKPIQIGEGQTISQPHVVALMLELLQPREGERVMDIGSGSGWATALLAEIVKKEGRVVAIERVPALYEMTKRNLAPYDFPQVLCMQGDGTQGYPATAPYDRIIAAATAQRIPGAWKEQLKDGGTMVFPVVAKEKRAEDDSFYNHHIVRMKKTGDTFEGEEYGGFAFVPLIEETESKQ